MLEDFSRQDLPLDLMIYIKLLVVEGQVSRDMHVGRALRDLVLREVVECSAAEGKPPAHPIEIGSYPADERLHFLGD